MKRRILLGLASLFWSLAALTASAQTDTCSNYLVPLVVRNAQGAMIRDLSAQDLEVKLGGNALPIESIQPDRRLRRIVILLDASGSMRGYGKEVPWSQAIASAQLLATLSEGRARLALLIFNEKILEEIAFGDDNLAIVRRLSELESDEGYLDRVVRGKTYLNDAMNRGLQLLKDPTSADALYVASDGFENGSRFSQGQVQRKAVESGVRIFAGITRMAPSFIGGQWRQPFSENRWEFPEAAEYTGGSLMFLTPRSLDLGFEVRPRPTFADGLRLFFEAMFANQMVQLASPNFAIGKGDLKIAASSSGQERLKHAQFFYPRQLYTCLPQAATAH